MSDQPRWTDYVPVDELPDAPTNPKGHADDDIEASIRRFRFVEPPLLDERTGKLVGGHGRRDALRRMRDAGEPAPEGVVVRDGAWFAPVGRGWASSDDDEAEAVGIALNRTGELGGWQDRQLAESLQRLAEQPQGLDGLGFDQAYLDDLLARLTPEPEPTPADPDDVPEAPKGKPVTRAGDVWELGRHRLVCGDSSDAATVALLLNGALINVAFTSPPYADRRKYDETTAFRPIPPDRYVEWFAPFAARVAENLATDGSWFVNIKPSADGLDTELYVFDLVLAHAREWGWHFATEFCWERFGVPGIPARRFKSQYEPIYQFARGEWKFRPQSVRHRTTDAIDYSRGRGRGTASQQQGRPSHDAFGGMRAPGLAFPGNRLPTFAGSHDATGHAAAFPVGLPAWFIKAFSDEGDAIYDPFMGSGSTLIAAEQENRVGYGIEISPAYCDVICARFQKFTGTKPIRNGEPVDFLTP